MKLRAQPDDVSSPSVEFTFDGGEQAINAATMVSGFTVVATELTQQTDRKIWRRQLLTEMETGREITVIERFHRTSTGVRWETEVSTDSDEPFTSPVISEISCGAEWPEYWSPWGDDRPDEPGAVSDPWAVADADLDAVKNLNFSWRNPLASRPAETRRFWYGAPYVENDNPRPGFSPFMNNLICMPLVSTFHASSDLGVTFALSPEDPLLDVYLDTDEAGSYRFTRMFYRLEKRRPLSFSADLFVHEGDWRGSLRTMAERYPRYFHSPLAITQDIAGTGAYSTHEVAFDEAKLKKMAFAVNWKASFDFPYMGIFLPDVPSDEVWTSYGDYPQTIEGISRYSAQMRERGFHVLSYFNVTEFGAAVPFPLPEPTARTGHAPDRLWEDPALYLSTRLKDALLMDELGRPHWTWGGAVVMDPGEPVFQEFLLDQARRHVELLPDASGICIDRLDWTRFYNDRRDDGISFFNGKPSRSLQVSWQGISEKLGELFHAQDKVVYCNNHTKRLEQMLHVDGMFDEFTYAAAALNLSAMLGLFKPVLGWIAHSGQVLPDYHQFFQRFLFMGVFPMAPFPGNDHSLLPSPDIDQAFLDYGPLLARLRGKRWTLSPRPVSVAGDVAIANVFEVADGYAVPIVFAQAETVRVTLRLSEFAMADQRTVCEVMQPGSDEPIRLPHALTDRSVEVDVPVRNGGALLLIRQGEAQFSKRFETVTASSHLATT